MGTLPKNIAFFNKIVQKKSFSWYTRKEDGTWALPGEEGWCPTLEGKGNVMVDMFSASVVMHIYENLNAKGQEKLAAMEPYRAAIVCFKVVDKARKAQYEAA